MNLIGRVMFPTSDNAPCRRVSLAAVKVGAIDTEAPVKPRMLRELVAWFRPLVARSANPVIRKLRLINAGGLHAEGSCLNRQEGGQQMELRAEGHPMNPLAKNNISVCDGAPGSQVVSGRIAEMRASVLTMLGLLRQNVQRSLRASGLGKLSHTRSHPRNSCR